MSDLFYTEEEISGLEEKYKGTPSLDAQVRMGILRRVTVTMDVGDKQWLVSDYYDPKRVSLQSILQSYPKAFELGIQREII